MKRSPITRRTTLKRSQMKRGQVAMLRTRMRRSKKAVNKVGRRTRERLTETNPALRAQAQAEGWWQVCEIRPLLVERGYLKPDDACYGGFTFCHALKTPHRRKDAQAGTPENNRTVAGGCRRHHFFVLDIPSRVPLEIACEIVLECIARRRGATA